MTTNKHGEGMSVEEKILKGISALWSISSQDAGRELRVIPAEKKLVLMAIKQIINENTRPTPSIPEQKQESKDEYNQGVETCARWLEGNQGELECACMEDQIAQKLRTLKRK